MSDTPRTDAAYFKPHATMYDLAGESKRLERELNAANERIKRLEEALEFGVGAHRMRELLSEDHIDEVTEMVAVEKKAKEAKS